MFKVNNSDIKRKRVDWRPIIGWSVFSLPFLALFTAIAMLHGFLVASAIFGTVLTVFGLFVIGALLIIS